MQVNTLLAAIAAFLQLVNTVLADHYCQSGNWTMRGDSCYKWFNNLRYWYDAEQVCRSYNGHLASIGSELENRLVGRLAMCRDAWIGRYGVNINGLADPAKSYAWTDDSDPARFYNHNFTLLNSVHKPLIRSDGDVWLNSLYHDRHPFVCEHAAMQSDNSVNSTSRCPSGCSLFENNSYVMPLFESNFNEANLYCQQNKSQLLSMSNRSELQYISELIIGADSCSQSLQDTVWLGLIKTNPCYPGSGNRELCYQWTDLSGRYQGFPAWQTGHPNTADAAVNCVFLSGDRLYSDVCHSRRRFVCKLPANGSTDPDIKPPPDDEIVAAAFDFRKGLTNMVNANTFIVGDAFGVSRNSVHGACFTHDERNAANHKPFYKISSPVGYNQSIFNQAEWTLFVRHSIQHTTETEHMNFITVYANSSNGGVTEAFGVHQRNHGSSIFMQTSHIRVSLDNIIYRYEHQMAFQKLKSACDHKVCNVSVTMNNNRANFRIDETVGVPGQYVYQNRIKQLGSLTMLLGYAPHHVNPTPSRYCVSCFGIVRKRLTYEELLKAYSTYCP